MNANTAHGHMHHRQYQRNGVEQSPSSGDPRSPGTHPSSGQPRSSTIAPFHYNSPHSSFQHAQRQQRQSHDNIAAFACASSQPTLQPSSVKPERSTELPRSQPIYKKPAAYQPAASTLVDLRRNEIKQESNHDVIDQAITQIELFSTKPIGTAGIPRTNNPMAQQIPPVKQLKTMESKAAIAKLNQHLSQPHMEPPAANGKRKAPTATDSMISTSHLTTASTCHTPSIDTSTDAGPSYVIALCEQTHSNVVGFCAMSSATMEVLVGQYNDLHTFPRTLMLLSTLLPVRVLVRDSSLDQPLAQLMRQELQYLNYIPILKRCFRAERGRVTLQHIGTAESLQQIKVDDENLSPMLAAAATCTDYMQIHCQYITAKASHSIKWQSSVGMMHIDYATATHLHLVPPNIRPSSKGSSTSSVASSICGNVEALTLYDVLNHTRTAAGARMLRVNLLQPPTNLQQIQLRQNVVQSLCDNDVLLQQLTHVLQRCESMSKVITQLVTATDRVYTDRMVQMQIQNIRELHGVLLQFPQLATMLGFKYGESVDASGSTTNTSQSQQPLQESRSVLQQSGSKFIEPPLQQLLAEMDRILDVTVAEQLQLPAAVKRRAVMLFSVKPDISEPLDVSRSSYIGGWEKCVALVEQLAHEYDNHKIELTYSTARGHHLIVPSELVEAPSTPDVFVAQNRRRNKVWCTTMELSSINDQMVGGSTAGTLTFSRSNADSYVTGLCFHPDP